MMLKCIYWTILLVIHNICCDAGPVVVTKYGSIEGESVVLGSGAVIDSYLAVPFAKPPIDELRFEAPLDPEPWNGTYQATEIGNACMQSVVNMIHATHFLWSRYSEDCLHMNIYSPQHAIRELLPVMVFIHGGGYTGGANFPNIGYFLAEKNVVFVAINYRLGIMGFAYTGDDTIPGNIGLLDQVQALKFIQENIADFGGDPARVTLFGQSAGATSAGLLLVSPLAEGLFDGVILQSGSELADWSCRRESQSSVDDLLDVADQLDCPTTDNEAMVDCLRGVNARRLINTRVNCTTATYCPGFTPIVDGVVIPDDPLTLRQSGEYHRVPEIIGLNEDDANLFVALVDFPTMAREGLNRSQYDDILWESVGLAAMDWPDPSRHEDVYQAMRYFYADWPYFNSPEKNREMFGKIYTDQAWGYPADLQAKYHSSDDVPVYFYVYDYMPGSYGKFFPEWMGAYHTMDLQFVFGWPFLVMEENYMARNHSQFNEVLRNYTVHDEQYSDLLMTLWTNFVKYGDPTPEPVSNLNNEDELRWPRFATDHLIYMNFQDTPAIRENYRQKEYAFWTEYLNYLIYGVDFYSALFKDKIECIIYIENINDDEEADWERGLADAL